MNYELEYLIDTYESTKENRDNLFVDISHKTNKRIYYKDGSSISKNDFNKLKSDVRGKYKLISEQLNDELRKARHETVVNKVEVDKILGECQHFDEVLKNIKYCMAHPDIEFRYERLLSRSKADKTVNTILLNSTYNNLKGFVSTLDLSEALSDKGIKFLIIKSEEGNMEFIFDPLGLTENFHEAIRDIFLDLPYYKAKRLSRTNGGGWMKMVDGKVVLYGESGDYGPFTPEVALNLCQALLPNMEVVLEQA